MSQWTAIPNPDGTIDCFVSPAIDGDAPTWLWLHRRGGLPSGPAPDSVGFELAFGDDGPADWCIGSFSTRLWTVTGEHPTMTVSPSLLCGMVGRPDSGCGRHGFIREGQWQDCG